MASRSKDILAVIPARSGSKGIPKKNILKIGGYPLIAYSIIAAKLARCVDRIIVNTDSEEFAKIARKYGAEVPFLRPKKFARDMSHDREWVIHILKWLKKHEGTMPEYIVHLRATSPYRHPKYIDQAIKMIIKNKKATSLRSAHEEQSSPYKYFSIHKGFYKSLFSRDDPKLEYHILPRQVFPPVYKPNSYVDILKSSFVLRSESLHGDKILPFITPKTTDIDAIDDLKHLTFFSQKEKWGVYEYLKNNFAQE